MAQTAAHLVDHVFPQVPVRQWVLSVPKRLRYFLHDDADLARRVQRILLRAIESHLKASCAQAPGDAQFAAVSFIQRFGSSLNAHLHYHCCIVDGVFARSDDGIALYEARELSPDEMAAVQREVRQRVLNLFVRRERLAPEAAQMMAAWPHDGGFSLDASIRIEAADRAGLERLLRYCARPPLSGERLQWDVRGEQVRYHLSKPLPDGQSVVRLTPMELLDRLAALIPPPRRHRHGYHGVFAPNAALRAPVTAYAGRPIGSAGAEATDPADDSTGHQPVPPAATGRQRRRASASAYGWALLLSRIFEILPLLCPRCAEPMQIIAFITDNPVIERILRHFGEPTTPPPVAPARSPPSWEADFDQSPAYDPSDGDPGPDYEYDQSVRW